MMRHEGSSELNAVGDAVPHAVNVANDHGRAACAATAGAIRR
jgi:hypothetical protein